jgi:nicotinamidase-related amidase
MAVTSLDERTALVVIDLQNGVVGMPTKPYTPTEVVARTVELADARPEGWDTLVEDLAGHPEDIVVTKRDWGAFHGTDLDLQLRRRGVTQIVLTGIATSIGVESTARAAHEHGYHVTLATDAMADRDDASHRHSIERIFPRLGETGTTSEILQLLEKTH